MKRGKPTATRPGVAEAVTAARAVLAAADTTLDGWSCEASTDCCRFGVTGREPFVTAVEWEIVRIAVAARGLPKRRLVVVDERPCRLLDERGRCAVYDARPLGCRTFYCDRASGPTRRPPRDTLAELGRKLADLSERVEPGEGPRALSRRLEELEQRGVAKRPR